MKKDRIRRLNRLIQQYLAQVIYKESDWSHLLLLSITSVDTAPDLSNSKVYVSIMGTDEQQQEAMQRLEHDKPHLRYQLAKTISHRCWPQDGNNNVRT